MTEIVPYFIVGAAAGAVLFPGSWLGVICCGVLNAALRLRTLKRNATA